MKLHRMIPVLFAAAALTGCSNISRLPSLMSLTKHISPPSPLKLVNMLGDDDPDYRREAVEQLAQRPFGTQEPYLKAYSLLARTDSNPLVRAAAIRALGLGGDPKYLPQLTAALHDQDTQVRWDAAVALNSITGESAIQPLINAAAFDRSAEVRVACLHALQHYQRPDVIEILQQCRKDGDFTIRYTAGRTLAALTGQPCDDVLIAASKHADRSPLADDEPTAAVATNRLVLPAEVTKPGETPVASAEPVVLLLKTQTAVSPAPTAAKAVADKAPAVAKVTPIARTKKPKTQSDVAVAPLPPTGLPVIQKAVGFGDVNENEYQ